MRSIAWYPQNSQIPTPKSHNFAKLAESRCRGAHTSYRLAGDQTGNRQAGRQAGREQVGREQAGNRQGTGREQAGREQGTMKNYYP